MKVPEKICNIEVSSARENLVEYRDNADVCFWINSELKQRLVDESTERRNESIPWFPWWFIPIMKKKAKSPTSSEMETVLQMLWSGVTEETVVSLKSLVP